MARFDETFADAFTKSANQASLMAFNRWKEEYKTSPKYLAQQALANPMTAILAKDNPEYIQNLVNMSKVDSWDEYSKKFDSSQQGTTTDVQSPISKIDVTQSIPSSGNSIQDVADKMMYNFSNPMITGGRIKNPTFYSPAGAIMQENIKSQFDVATAKEKGLESKVTEGKYKALMGTLKDSSVLNMFGSVIKDLVSARDEAEKGGFAGNKYKQLLGRGVSEGYIPEGLIPFQTPEGLNAANRFISARNETITRMQPILSEQFGERGSMRIMDSLIKMAQQEIGDLNEPRKAFIGKAEGTLKNMYRFLKGSSDFFKKANITSDQLENMSNEQVDNLVRDTLSSKNSRMSKAEQDELSSFIKESIGEASESQSIDSIIEKYASKGK